MCIAESCCAKSKCKKKNERKMDMSNNKINGDYPTFYFLTSRPSLFLLIRCPMASIIVKASIHEATLVIYIIVTR